MGDFVKRLDFGGDLFNSPQAKRLKSYIKKILKAEELGNIKDISSLIFKECDANKMECLEEQLDCYRELYCDPDSFEFDQEYFDLNVDRDYPGFKEFFEWVSLFNDKIKREELTLSEFMSITSTLIFDSDSDSDSDSD